MTRTITTRSLWPALGGLLIVAGEYIDLAVDTYLTTDPMCCPSGWEMLRLAPTELRDLWPLERCTGPENHYCLSE